MITSASPHSAPAPPTIASALWVDAERFLTAGSSGHAVVLDADRVLNSAPGPMEMVLRSLCACSATDVLIVLKKTRQAFRHVEVSAEGERAPAPPQVYTHIHLRYRVLGERVDRSVVERAVALSHAKYCSVFLMLQPSVAITHEIDLEAPPA